MKFLKDFDWSFKSIAKVLGIIVMGMLAIAIVIGLVSFALTSLKGNRIINQTTSQIGGFFGGDGNNYYDEYEEMDMAMAEMAYPGDVSASRMATNSYYPTFEPATGDDAEEYEVKNYNGTIQTRNLDETCNKIADLKSREDVIFENSDKNDDSCYYSFKVEKEKDQEIIALIESMNPEYFNANIQSIKGSVEYVESELEILTKKLTSVEETLANAQSAYDEISQIATEQQDAASLATIIDSKLNLIERLTSERLMIKEQIDRYNQSKADQLDRLNYTFFNISAYKDVIFDWKQLKDNWKFEAKQFVQNINKVFQGLTLNLVHFLFGLAQAVVYIFISVFLLKWVWKGVKWIWKGNKRGH